MFVIPRYAGAAWTEERFLDADYDEGCLHFGRPDRNSGENVCHSERSRLPRRSPATAGRRLGGIFYCFSTTNL